MQTCNGVSINPIDEAIVSLRFFGEDLDPDEITKLLMCPPSTCYRKGDVIPMRDGKIATQGCWRLELQEGHRLPLARQILSLLDRVHDDPLIWPELTRRYRADVFCGVCMRGRNRRISLPADVIKALSRRSIEIHFDIYYQAEDDAHP